MKPLRFFVCVVAGLLLALLAAGCGSYSIQGRVVAGANPMITFVPEHDSALEYGRPVTEAAIELVRDPESLGRESVARTRSGPSGWFSMPVGAFGAGWMDEMWEVSATSPGFQGVSERLRLPGKGDGMIMLIIMSEGADPATNQENLLEQFERYR